MLAVIEELDVRACSHVSECASELAGSGGAGGSGVVRLDNDGYISDQLYRGGNNKK
jgi:hypothetical protein